MLSRVADSIYWLSRYIERAENVARFIDVNLRLLLDLPAGVTEQWHPLVTTTGDHALFQERYGQATQHNVITFLTFDPVNPNSIAACLQKARDNARSVREVISSEMWEQVNRFYLMVHDPTAMARVQQTPHDFFTEVKMASHLFVGITDTTMSHNEGWHFGRMGRLVSRADMTTRLLDVKYFLLLPSVAAVGTPLDEVQWAAVLKSASAFEMYRKRYGRIAPEWVADFLLMDREFPRSTRWCLSKAEESLHAITGSPPGTFRNLAEQRLGRLRAELEYTSIQEILSAGLHEFLDGIQSKLNQIGDAIFETFFALRPVVAGATAYPRDLPLQTARQTSMQS